jgi:hypothetical protein
MIYGDRRIAMAAGQLCGVFGAATSVLLILLVAAPAYATHSKHSSAGYHLSKGPSVNEYSREGLPCSTASTPQASKSRSFDSLHQLEQIEHAGLATVRSSSGRGTSGKSVVHRPVVIRGSDRQPAINFVYHVSSGARAKGR